MKLSKAKAGTPVIRCAIYTRKSTEEGLQQEFNSLDAQRESGEAYVASQRSEGWECLPDRYDDGGFTGGNMERPALQQLMADIQAGKIDCVVVYKVDRMTRSLLDFAKIVETFDRHHVSFVAVTQLINTATSMGRLMLNVLLSFAQFEREIISERTRDKIAATRRKGKWSGGMPLLGYDVVETKLVVVPPEAEQVRQIFDLYLASEGLIPVVEELDRRGWRTKRWITKKGTERGGRSFGKNSPGTCSPTSHTWERSRTKTRSMTVSMMPSSKTTCGSACKPSSNKMPGLAARRCETSSGRCSRDCCIAHPAAAR